MSYSRRLLPPHRELLYFSALTSGQIKPLYCCLTKKISLIEGTCHFFQQQHQSSSSSSVIMFLPSRSVHQEKEARRAAYQQIEADCRSLLHSNSNSSSSSNNNNNNVDNNKLQEACTISVQEVQCGDPNCAPIDTLITFMFASGGQGFFGLPMEAKEVTKDHLRAAFPPAEIFEKWYHGEDAEWPPEPEPEPVELRFAVGAKVLCRVGPTEWAAGTVVQLWYRENAWQPGMYAPYKVHLEDGRDIFAPQDLEQVIRLNPAAAAPQNQQQQQRVRQAMMD